MTNTSALRDLPTLPLFARMPAGKLFALPSGLASLGLPAPFCNAHCMIVGVRGNAG